MKYNKTTMLKLINEHRELHDELKKLKSEMGLEKTSRLKRCTIQLWLKMAHI